MLFNALSNNPKYNTSFVPPLKIPLSLSANFGELRADHYHSGLDIKTQGVTGKEVCAAASGYVYRITVSPGGFGKALYIRHPSGFSTVYGHLEKFIEPIDEYVRAYQYEKKSYMVNLYPPRDKFNVSQGEVVAYSGNTGSSGGPHLHFEIRKSESEVPVNPLLFDFAISDRTKPIIQKLAIYPVYRNTLINDKNREKIINVTGTNGEYSIPSDTEITVSGAAGFGIKSFDKLDDSNNRCAIYSIELLIDSTTIFRYVMDAFSFNESRYVNSHIDYDTYQRDNMYIERAFVLPNDKLSVYKNLVNRGIYIFNDNKTHSAEIIASDVYGNKATLSFKIKALPLKAGNPPEPEPEPENSKLMPFGRSNSFEAENIRVNIPGGALYDTILFSYRRRARTKGMLSDLHSVHNKYTPVHLPYELSIKPDTIPEGKRSKMLLVMLDDDHKVYGMNSHWSEGYVTAEVMSFGNFYAGIDTVAPEISASGFSEGVVLTGIRELRIRITDDLSGINYYEPEIDGKWALFEYDQKNNVIICNLEADKITRGIKHNLSLKVADNKDNISYFNRSFTW